MNGMGEGREETGRRKVGEEEWKEREGRKEGRRGSRDERRKRLRVNYWLTTIGLVS